MSAALQPDVALLLVLSHPSFFRIERYHSAHHRDCPQIIEDDGLPCERYRIGLILHVGRVEWFDAARWEEAVQEAATQLDHIHIERDARGLDVLV